MYPFFALTFRGLEPISALEIAQHADLHILDNGYRHIRGYAETSLQTLLTLRTVDDIFLHVATWNVLARQRATLAHLAEISSGTDWHTFAQVCATLRPIKPSPLFSVTASFVGKRNYTTDEIKQAVAEGIAKCCRWSYTTCDSDADINVRLFIEGERALVGVRLGKSPLYQRGLPIQTQSGSLKPIVAAAMAFLAAQHGPHITIDPCCGAGILAIEASRIGLRTYAGDIHPLSVRQTQDNAHQAGLNIPIAQWDATQVPFADKSVSCIIANPPWGKQVDVGQPLPAFYNAFCAEINRIISPQGVVVLLTTVPLPSYFPDLYCINQYGISLFGQTPTLWVFTAP